MKRWLVAGGVIEGPEGLVLVRNQRRDGRLDWSTPGGVIDDGETVIQGLTREVAEETGLLVADWEGPLYDVAVEAPGMGWHLRVEVHRALAVEGSLCADDPDGIVVDARFVPPPDIPALLAATWRPLHEPLLAWLADRETAPRSWAYRIDGDQRETMMVVPL